MSARPMPSPNGTNHEGLTLPTSRVTMAQDAALHALDVADGLGADGSGNEAVRQYRKDEERRRMFPHWDRMRDWQ